MLTIDRLRLTIPASFRGRESAIARLVAEELAEIPLASDLSLDRLAVPPVAVAPTAGNREVAKAIAAAVGVVLEKEMR